MNLYKTTKEVLQDMLADFKDITGISLSTTDLNREEVIKMFPFAGAVSMYRADLQRAYDDIFPRSASIEGLIKHLAARRLPTRKEPQGSIGVARLTGLEGTPVLAGTQIKSKLDGKIYVATASGTVLAGKVDIPFRSLEKGSAQNVSQIGLEFKLDTAINGIDETVTSITSFLGGRDLEAPGEMLERIETYDQDANSGGNLVAYETWAKDASDQVVTATSIKHARGVGTVDTVITSGTTDIEATIKAGLPVLRLPGPTLITQVQVHILSENPTTDDHQTIAPVESDFDIEIVYSLHDENNRSLVDDEITLISKVFIYEARSGTTIHPTELERRIDRRVGHLIKERRVKDFTLEAPEKVILKTEILSPRTITVGPIS